MAGGDEDFTQFAALHVESIHATNSAGVLLGRDICIASWKHKGRVMVGGEKKWRGSVAHQHSSETDCK